MTKFYQVTCGEYTTGRYYRNESDAKAAAERRNTMSKGLMAWVATAVWLNDDSADDDRRYNWKG